MTKPQVGPHICVACRNLGYLTPVSLITAPYKQKQPTDTTADVTPDASAVDHTRMRREQ